MAPLRKIKEILSDPELRSWMLFKALNPGDKGLVSKHGLPPYLDENEINVFIDLKESKLDLNQLNKVSKTPPLENVKINLASKDIEIPYKELTEINFFESSDSFLNKLDDVEDRESFFRLSVLLHSLEGQNGFSEIEEKIVKDWINADCMDSNAWYPYTIAERLANIGIFLCRSQCYKSWSNEFKELFLERILNEGLKLYETLEYFGEDLTCNHLSNNGRGIMWAGYLLGSAEIIKLGSRVMKSEFDRIVQNHGIIREGSSHYQLLVTRNYLEACWVLKNSGLDAESRDFEKMAKKLQKGSQFLMLQGINPLVGDISPDFSPEWFKSVISTKNSSAEYQGWRNHFSDFLVDDEEEFMGAKLQDDFIRIDKDGFSVLIHINKSGFPMLPGHAHCDSSSLVVVYMGRELLIDLGRKDYKKESNHYLRDVSHNSIRLNNSPKEFLPRGVYGKEFIQKISGGSTKIKVDEEVNLEIPNYKRIGFTVTSNISIQNGEVHITYKINGKGKTLVTLPFHAPDSNSIEFEWPMEHKAKLVKKLRSKKYGFEEECFSFIWEKIVTIPCELTVKIKPIS